MQTKIMTILCFICILGMPMAVAHAQPADITSNAANTMGDAEIIGMLNVINDGEIDASKTAAGKDVPASVSNFANMMVQDHERNRDQSRSLASQIGISPNEEGDAKDLRAKSMDQLKRIQKLSGDQFAKAYMDQMVEDHTNALNAIDTKLLPNVKNDQLKAHLTATRDAVSKHLSEAKDIRAKL